MAPASAEINHSPQVLGFLAERKFNFFMKYQCVQKFEIV